MMDVGGVGACSIDFVYLLPDTPRPDSAAAKLPISGQLVSPGGQTATVLCTCASFGLSTRLIATIGDDPYAATMREALSARGVDISGLVERKGATPYAVVLVDAQHGERMVLWHRPPGAALRPEDVPAHMLADARLVHVDDVDVTAAMAAARMARAAGRTVTSDIERSDAHARQLIDAVDVAILAEHVPAALEPTRSPEQALAALQTRPNQMLCVTLGARGAILLAGGEVYTVAGHAVRVVDTTGAGDVFRGAFITALLRGDSPGAILAFANAAAAASCTTLGAIGGVPTLAETEAVLKSRR